jgi:hypothetical protein
MIDKAQLVEEGEAIFRFIYGLHHDAWLEFCNTERKDKGNQSLQSTSMLVRSLTQPRPWRFMISMNELDVLTFNMGGMFLRVAKKIMATFPDGIVSPDIQKLVGDFIEMAEKLKLMGETIQNREEHEA